MISGMPVPAAIFVSDQNSNSITGYANGATGNVAPFTTIAGAIMP